MAVLSNSDPTKSPYTSIEAPNEDKPTERETAPQSHSVRLARNRQQVQVSLTSSLETIFEVTNLHAADSRSLGSKRS